MPETATEKHLRWFSKLSYFYSQSECTQKLAYMSDVLFVLFCLIPAAMGPCNVTGVDNVIPLTGETGRLFSPLYPQTYPNDMMCTWKINVPEGHYVRLRITSFDLGFSCRGTALKIHDGQSSSGNLLKSFCGRTFDRSVFSSGRYLWVRFQSPKDGYVYGTGFNAVFEAVTQCKAVVSILYDPHYSFYFNNCIA